MSAVQILTTWLLIAWAGVLVFVVLWVAVHLLGALAPRRHRRRVRLVHVRRRDRDDLYFG